MKHICYIVITLLFATYSQAANNPATIKASQRSIPITAEWTDRAQVTGTTLVPGTKNILWYKQPAKVWEEALPLGNGHMGAMIFGGVADERIQLNEHTLWDGRPVNPNNPEALGALPEVQRLLFEDKNKEAVKLASETMLGRPTRIKSYQSLGELWFDTPQLNATDYVRTLDLSTAIATTEYKSEGVTYKREYFASSVDNVVVMRITADQKNKINLSLSLRREQDAKVETFGSNALLLKGTIMTSTPEGTEKGMSFASLVKATINGGKISVSENPGSEPVLTVENADVLTLYITAATNYPGMANIAKGNTTLSGDPIQKSKEKMDAIIGKPYDTLRTAHIAGHQEYFNRVDLNLGTIPSSVATLPTDERLALANQTGQPDLGLVETYFQFGRYLLICSSRPGGMPANLQGLWAWQMNAPWNADYHTNINFQMNYWPSGISNLPEMQLPMIDLMEMLVRPGGLTARKTYNAKGWVVHHLTDVWGFTAPADGPQGIWPMGSAWLAQHPWEQYCYTGDKKFLRERAYPLMKGAAEFIIDFLIEAPAGTAYAGKLVTNPSYSPENTFYLPDGTTSEFTYGATMDLQIIRDLLTNCIDACEILKTDDPFRKQCEQTLARIPETRISKRTGRIMEWAEDYEEVDPHHRHTSHLFGLHPGNQITVVGTPELAEAARKTLTARGDDGTGWGLAWKINMWNRLHDGDHAFKLLSVLLGSKTLPNLFDTHPPFQIDGNFGATAAIAEMLLQSQLRKEDGSFEIELLPSLPSAMSASGNVKGLRARGGFTLDITWNNGRLTQAVIHSALGGKLNLRNGEKSITYNSQPGETIKINGDLKK